MVEYVCKNKNSSNFINYDIVFLNVFDKERLKITSHDCVDRIIYHIDYQKEKSNKTNPLFILIPEFLGYIKKDRKKMVANIYLLRTKRKKNDLILKYRDKIYCDIISSILDIDDEDHKLSDYYIDSLDRFKISSVGNDDQFNELPIDTLLKFSYTIISSRLVIKKDSKLILESYLEECFYERIYKMGPKSLKIKNGSYYFWNDMIYLDKFDDKMLKVNKREIRESNNIYYISYVMNKPEHNVDSVNNLYFIVHNLY